MSFRVNACGEPSEKFIRNLPAPPLARVVSGDQIALVAEELHVPPVIIFQATLTQRNVCGPLLACLLLFHKGKGFFLSARLSNLYVGILYNVGICAPCAILTPKFVKQEYCEGWC